MKHSKRYKENYDKIDRLTQYSLTDAISLLKEFKTSKFDETVELSINLGVDPKHAEQQ